MFRIFGVNNNVSRLSANKKFSLLALQQALRVPIAKDALWPGSRHDYWSRVEFVIACDTCSGAVCAKARDVCFKWSRMVVGLTHDRMGGDSVRVSIEPFLSVCAPQLLAYGLLGELPFPDGMAANTGGAHLPDMSDRADVKWTKRAYSHPTLALARSRPPFISEAELVFDVSPPEVMGRPGDLQWQSVRALVRSEGSYNIWQTKRAR